MGAPYGHGMGAPAVVGTEGPGWQPPEEIGAYFLVAQVGQGGMGEVYLARDRQLDRLVALKFMTAPLDSPPARERFVAEAKALARLHHPNVVEVYAIDEADGHPFIAYEYVRGKSLDKLLLPLRWQTALEIGVRIARALRAAHRAHLLHRDVKPSNVMITPAGEVKLLDFGLAISTGEEVAQGMDAEASRRAARAELAAGRRLTAPGFAVGTPRYWSPEQWQFAAVTPATDVYGAGLVMYEMLTGEPPNAALAGRDLAEAMAAEDAPRLDPALAPQAFLDVVRRCLRRAPEERFASGTELAAALEPVELVFANRARPEVTLGSDEDLVAASWARATTHGRRLADRAYELLFAMAPDLRALLPTDLDAQKAKLLHALDLTVRGLHHPEQLTPMLRELGARHVGYGVDVGQIALFGRALRRALAELDPEWSAALDAAWEHAYGFVVAAMRAGMEATRPSSAPMPPAPPPAVVTPAPPSRLTPPRTAYAQVDGAAVAYHAFGEGPPDIVLLPSGLTQVEATWAHPAPVALLASLARFARVVMFDARGCGLSDPLDGPPSTEAMVADALAVMDATSIPHAIVVASGEAALPGIRLAATRPERVAGLVLVGAAPRLSAAPDYPEGLPAEFWDDLTGFFAAHWGEPILAELLTPSALRDPSFTAWFASYFRVASSPRRATALLGWARRADERSSLPHIVSPTLVLRRRGDPLLSDARARDLAAAIHGARFVEIEGDDHFLFAGDPAPLAHEIERFAAGLGQTEATAVPRAPAQRLSMK